MKDMKYYTKQNTLYPNKKDYQTTYYYKAGVCIGDSNSIKPSEKEYTVKETILDEKSYREHLALWYQEKKGLQEEFKQDLFEYLGITNNPKREKLFNIAWNMSSSEGHDQVLNTADILVELID